MTISYSAPAKCIISGDHSVNYGKPVLASAFQLRLTFLVQSATSLDTKNPHFNILQKIDEAVKNYLQKNQIDFKTVPFHFQIKSNIPINQGFGSSAALCAAATACLVELYTGQTVDTFSKEKINEIAYECEKIFNENTDGIDNTTSVFGGLVFMRKEFDFLQLTKKVDFTISESMQERMYLVHLGNRFETSKDLDLLIQQKCLQDPANMKKSWHDFEKTTKQIIAAIHDDQPVLLSKSIRRNHNLLAKIGVVSKSSLRLIHQLQDFGEIKITGAGGQAKGSGYGLLFASENKQAKLQKFLQNNGLLYFSFNVDEEGLRKETV